MGWCSGTPIFDAVAEVVLASQQTDDEKAAVLKPLIEAMWDHDWDCESDSPYYDDPLVQRVMRELRPDWFEDEDEDE